MNGICEVDHGVGLVALEQESGLNGIEHCIERRGARSLFQLALWRDPVLFWAVMGRYGPRQSPRTSLVRVLIRRRDYQDRLAVDGAARGGERQHLLGGKWRRQREQKRK